MYKVFASAAALAAASFTVPAQATTVVVDYALDPSLISSSISQDILPTPFTAGVGDTVEFHLTFTTPTVTLSGDTALWLLSLTNSGSTVLDVSSSWTFLSPSANLIPTVIVPSQIAQNVHIGTYISSGQYRLDSAPITFSGIDLTVSILGATGSDIDSDGVIDGPPVDPRTYYSIALVPFNGVVGSPSVPEPASWAMMLAGFGAIGGAMRSRRSKVAVSFG